MKSSTDTQNMGMSHSFYAKQDGELASAGSKDDDLSPTTSSWIYFMKANPGACYPLILGEFQFKVLSKCDEKSTSTRNIIFVKELERKWTDDDIIEGSGFKVKENFTQHDDISKEFYAKTMTEFSTKENLKAAFTDSYEMQAIQLKGKSILVNISQSK